MGASLGMKPKYYDPLIKHGGWSMRIEDIIDDEYWMTQLLNLFNRRGLVKTPIWIDQNKPAREDDTSLSPAENEPVDQVRSNGSAESIIESKERFKTFDD